MMRKNDIANQVSAFENDFEAAETCRERASHQVKSLADDIMKISKDISDLFASKREVAGRYEKADIQGLINDRLEERKRLYDAKLEADTNAR